MLRERNEQTIEVKSSVVKIRDWNEEFQKVIEISQNYLLNFN